MPPAPRTLGALVWIGFACCPALAAAAPFTVRAFPERLVLGVDSRARLAISAARPLQLQAFASTGQVADLKQVGPTEWTASYVPPARKYPQVAILAFREEAEDGDVAFAVIPLHGQHRIQVATKPLTKVLVRIGDVPASPVRASARGKVTIPIRVPPGVGVGELVVVDARGRETKTKVDLRVPPFPRILLVPHRREAAADGREIVPLSVFAIDEKAHPAAGLPVRIAADVGEVGPIRDLGGGLYRAEYRAPVRGSPGRAALRASLGAEASGASLAEIALRALIPRRITVAVHPPRLVADGRSRARIEILLDDGNGIGIHGEELRLETSAGRVTAVKDQGRGRYLARYTAPGLRLRQPSAEPAAVELRVRHVARSGDSAAPPTRRAVFLAIPPGETAAPAAQLAPPPAPCVVDAPLQIPSEPEPVPVALSATCNPCVPHEPPPPAHIPRLLLGAQLGGALTRGAASGYGVAVGIELGYRLPVWGGRLVASFSWTALFPRGTAGFNDPFTGQPAFHGWMFPVMTGLRYRAQWQHVAVSFGLELGVLLVNLGFGQGPTEELQTGVLAAMQLPVAVDFMVGGGSFFVESRWLQSLHGLEGDAMHVNGAVTGLVFSAGYRHAF